MGLFKATFSTLTMFHLIFATNNAHKVEEVRAVLGTAFTLETMGEAGIGIDIPEPHDTLEANALEKARTIWNLTGKDCFSEDSGLEVTALNGEPGVRSARYAGEDRSPRANIDKLLERLHASGDRSARFRTVIALILNEKEYLFEGVCSGHILEEIRGEGGFGYDPVFVPDGAACTFAEMSLEGKSGFSHRKKAMDRLINFLKNLPDGQNKD
jgi:XTP/dITP diphosphohydrolase